MARRSIRKKGYMRTMEAFLAFFLTFVFVVLIVMKGTAAKPSMEQFEVLPALSQRDDFRACVYAGNTTCAEQLIDPFIPGSFRYKVSIGSPEPFKGAKDIYTETVFITSNQTNVYKVIFLYYWPVTG